MQTTDARREVRRVLLVTMLLNFAVAFGKIAIGTLTGSLAIAADGVHSAIDGASNVIALVASHIAARPPDADHPYGHRRFETLAAMLIGVMLLVVGWEVITGAVERLRSGERAEITPLALAVVGATLVVNLFVSTWERRAGRRLKSELLLADAANTGADVFVTLSVLVSSMVSLAFGWAWVDPLAALVIVVLIGRAAWQVLDQTSGVLLDRAPYTPERLETVAASVPAVERVVRARSRGPADAAHIDVDVQVARETTADHTAAIADAIRAAMREQLDGVAEVEVHFEPREAGEPDYALAARARADALGLSTHEVRLSEGTHGKVLEMHVEVPPGQTLGEAHAQVSRLERAVRGDLPDVADVITHIEPAQRDADGEALTETARRVGDEALALLRARFPYGGWHDVRLTRHDGGLALTLHVALPASTSLEEAHRLAEAAETLLRTRYPMVQRATIHTEPPEDA